MLFSFIQKALCSKPYEFIDIGAAGGIMVCLALCFGAKYSVGIELKESPEHIFRTSFLPLFSQHGVSISSRVDIQFGVSSSNMDSLRSLQLSHECMPRVAYTFCDGFNEDDRHHIFFHLVGRDPLITLLLCSPGRGRGDKLNTYGKILEVLNAAGVGSKFKFHSVVKVSMCGSGSKKRLFVFKRS